MLPTILLGDARALPLRDASVHCVVTSPPYWGLRDYGIPPGVWGGDPACAHTWGGTIAARGESSWDTFNAYRREGFNNRSAAGKTATIDPDTKATGHGAFCPCGAWRGVLGLEPTPELYVAHLVAVFREVWRVLKDDGTVWLNLGDSYAGTSVVGRNDTTPDALARRAAAYHAGTGNGSRVGASGARPPVANLKAKNLVGIPWRVAFALQADGWWLRSDIIWSKPNPMPESVTDRPTKAHEYLFLLARAERYYYDAEAVKERSTERPSGNSTRVLGLERGVPGNGAHRGASIPYVPNGTGRNRRSVWEIPTQPYAEAHFATFPEALVEPCILAGSPAGGIVLDPFAGSGTVGEVCARHGRRFVGTDLNPTYASLACARTAQAGLL